MGKTAILAIRIIGDATGAVSALESVDGSAASMQASMDRASIGAGVALGALGVAAKLAGDAASEAEQAAGAVDSVFKSLADGVHEYAATADESVGLSTAAYENLAAVLGSQLKNMGVSLEDAGGKTAELIELGADLSATFGGTTADAVAALSSLLRGERDPIERYGVSMNQAAVDAQKAAMGLSGLSGEADKNATLQATLALLTAQTADAQGQFAREADTASGQAQRADAAWQNAAATLGEKLLPFMTAGSEILAGMAGWVSDNVELVTFLAAAIGGLAAGVLIINGAMKVYAAIQAVQTAAQWANNAAWLASPITWIILAIVAAIALVIAIVVLLIQHWDDVQRVAGQVWQFVLDCVNNAATGFNAALSAIGTWWNDLVGSWQRGIDGFIGMIRDALDWLGRLIGSAVPGWVKDLLGMGGQSFTARMIVDDPAPAPMMAFSAAETMAGFTGMSVPAAPAFTTVIPADAGLASTGSPRTAQPVEIIVNFNGLVTDPEAAAREIRKILDDSDRTNGRKVAVGVGS